MAKAIARPSASNLYEEDFPLWAERQAALLRAKRFDELDLENLIEEVEDLSRRERETVVSHVETILEHFLQLAFSPAERPRRGWLVTVDKRRVKLARELTATLRSHLEAELPALYAGLRRPVARQLEKDHVPADALPAALSLHARPDPRSGLVPRKRARHQRSRAMTKRVPRCS